MDKKYNAGILVLTVALMASIVYMANDRRDSIYFTTADRFDLPNQKELNISIPNGYSMRSEHVSYSGLLFTRTAVYGWYLSKAPCTQSVEMPDPDRDWEKDIKGMENFTTHIANLNGGDDRIDGFGICIERTNDGVLQAYADKKTREDISLPETTNLIQMGLKLRMLRDQHAKDSALAEKQKKESWNNSVGDVK